MDGLNGRPPTGGSANSSQKASTAEGRRRLRLGPPRRMTQLEKQGEECSYGSKFPGALSQPQGPYGERIVRYVADNFFRCQGCNICRA